MSYDPRKKRKEIIEERILGWLCCGSDPAPKLHFTQFPEGVSGITHAVGDDTVSAVSGYSSSFASMSSSRFICPIHILYFNRICRLLA